MANQNNIRVIFSPKADDTLSGIIKKYGLEEYNALVKIDYISKSFAIEKISEKEMSDYLQKELKISAEIAEQVSKEIVNNIIPFLIKAPEEKFNDPKFVEEISKKIFGEPIKEESAVKKDSDISPKIKPLVNINKTAGNGLTMPEKKLTEDIALPPKKQLRPKKITENRDSTQEKRRGPDSYREKIE